MSSAEAQASRLLELPSDAYSAISEDQVVELQTALAGVAGSDSAAPAPLLAIGAPREVAESGQLALPVLVGTVQSGLRAWEINVRTNLWLMLRSLSTGELSPVTPFNDMRRGDSPLLSGVGTPPEPIVANSWTSSVHTIDVPAQLERPLQPGRYALTAVAYDLRSNTVGFHLQGTVPEPTILSAPPQAYLAVRDAVPAEGPATAAMPATAAAGEPVKVHLAYRVSAEDGVLGAEAAQPVWPCHVLLIQPDETPIVVAAFVPVRRVAAGAGAARFDAAVDIDLRAALGAALSGTYQVYVDVGRELLGPYRLAVDGP